MRQIMIATDGSEGAGRAVDVAANIAKATGSKLSILNVGGNLSGDEIMQLARAERDLGAALDAISNQILMQSKERARQIGVSTIKVQVAWGDPAEAIIETARREQVDAIVVGRRGRGRLAGFAAGERVTEGRKSRSLHRDSRSNNPPTDICPFRVYKQTSCPTGLIAMGS